MDFLMLLKIRAAIAAALHGDRLRRPGARYGRTPGIPRSRPGHGRTRAKAPNDGRWHMRYHRGRVRG